MSLGHIKTKFAEVLGLVSSAQVSQSTLQSRALEKAVLGREAWFSAPSIPPHSRWKH